MRPLEYYIHDESDALRFELAGSLSGVGAESVHQAWKTALSIIHERPLVVDVTFIHDADEHGRALLLGWHRRGARIIAASPESRSLVEAVLGECPPAPRTNQSWFRRLSGVLFGPAVSDGAKSRR